MLHWRPKHDYVDFYYVLDDAYHNHPEVTTKIWMFSLYVLTVYATDGEARAPTCIQSLLTVYIAPKGKLSEWKCNRQYSCITCSISSHEFVSNKSKVTNLPVSTFTPRQRAHWTQYQSVSRISNNYVQKISNYKYI
jgi:hypothetical protein